MADTPRPDAPASATAVPFLDLRAPYAELTTEIDDALRRVAAGGWYILGEELRRFEEHFARYVGARFCVGVANGLDALQLALRALGVGPGDEVIVPSNTYIATWIAVSQVGAVPVPVEPDERTYNIDPQRIERAITPRTKAIIPVHLYGLPADLTAINEIAARHGLAVLDDAAQSHGATIGGRMVGALANATAWSFYPGKNLGALGDAGAVTTDDEGVADRIRVLRNYGSRVKYVNDVLGYNSRLDDIQAAVLDAKLPHLAAWNARRAAIATQYSNALAGTPLTLPIVPAGLESAWHLYVVRSSDRATLQARLKERGVETLIHYPIPPHRQGAYASLGLAEGTLPISEAMHREVLSLPIGPHMTPAQVDRVIEAVTEAAADLEPRRR